MAARSDYFKLGLFVVGAAAIAVAAIVALAAGELFRSHVRVETYLDETVQTLAVGSLVKFRGVEVGEVDEITFVRTMLPRDHPDFIRFGRYVRIVMSLDANLFEDLTAEDIEPVLARLIQDGLRVRLDVQGLTGQTQVEVDHVDPASNPPLPISWEPEHHYIPSAPSTFTRISQTIDRVFAQIEEADIPTIAASLDRFLNVSTQVVQEARVNVLSDSLVALAKDLQKTNARVEALLGDPALAGLSQELARGAAAGRAAVEGAAAEMPALLADLRAGAASLRAAAGSIERLASAPELEAVPPALARAADELPGAIAELSSALRRAGRLLAGRDGDVAALLVDLRAIADNVRRLTENAQAFPAQVLFGAPPQPVEGVR